MSASKHTPGPWALDDVLPNGHCKVRGPAGLVAVVGNGERAPEAFEANARLIAAAPELLVILHEAKAALDYASRGADVITSDKLAVTIERIAAALAKAEGHPPTT